MSLQIITDNKWKFFKYGYEVPESVLNGQFEHLRENDSDCDSFILYKKRWYHVSDFMRIPEGFDEPMQKYDGYMSDSFFSGVLIKLSDDSESYQIATYIS